MAKQPIPEVRTTDNFDYLFRKSVRDNLNRITANSAPPLGLLPDTASNADVIAKVNAIIRRLEGV